MVIGWYCKTRLGNTEQKGRAGESIFLRSLLRSVRSSYFVLRNQRSGLRARYRPRPRIASNRRRIAITTTNDDVRSRSYGASAQAARKSRMKESYKVEIGHQLWPRVMRGNRQLFRRSVHRGTARLSIELRKHYRLRWPTQSYLGEGYSHVGR